MSPTNRSPICAEHPESAFDLGYCAAQKLHYFGYEAHACTQQGLLKVFDITGASVHDIHYFNDVKEQFNHCVLIGDKGYLSRLWQRDLFKDSAISLETPMRSNQIDKKPFPKVFRKARKRIETLFSQLCDQFMIRRNYVKSFVGFSTRTIAKMTSLALIQWFNKKEILIT